MSQHRRETTRRLVGARLMALSLSVCAALGVVTALVLLASLSLGIKPVIVQSGSMGEALPTGSLAFATSVPAADLAVGDVVTVPIPGTSQTVTHRVRSIAESGAPTAGARSLELRGDANPVSDHVRYVVTSAPRVVAHLPHLGGWIAWLTRAPGVYLLAGYAAVLLIVIGRSGGAQATSPAGRGRRAAVIGTAAILGLSTTGVSGARAAWSDGAGATGSTVASGKILGPAHLASGRCSTSNVLVTSTITLNWKGVEAAVTDTPMASQYRYIVEGREGSGAWKSIYTLGHTGGVGSNQSAAFTTDFLSNLLSFNLLATRHLEFRVTAGYIPLGDSALGGWTSGSISFLVDVYLLAGLPISACV